MDSQIYQGDCLDVMSKIEDHSIDLVLCDPPYGITGNKWDTIIPYDELWKHYKRVIKPKGVIILFSHGLFTAKIMLSNESWYRYKLVWIKSKATGFLQANKQPLRKHEDICVFYEGQPDYNPVMTQGDPYNKGIRKGDEGGTYGNYKEIYAVSDGQRYPTDTLYCKTSESEPGEKGLHPTQKPIALGRYLIRMFTNEEDVVMDNAFGSGSFLVAAKLENRNYIGIEKNPDFVEIAKSRLQNVSSYKYSSASNSTSNSNYKGIVNIDEIFSKGQSKSQMEKFFK